MQTTILNSFTNATRCRHRLLGIALLGIACIAVSLNGRAQCLNPSNLVWEMTGPDASSSSTATGITLSYNFNHVSAEPETEWTLTTVAPNTTELSFDWYFSGIHGWFRDWVELVAFADGPQGTTYIDLVATPHCEFCQGETDGPFAFGGSTDLPVHQGYEFGFIAVGANFDCCSRLKGLLEVEFLCPDADGDGIPDVEDDCPDSDLSPTVVLGGRDSGVPNLLFPSGCTLTDTIGQLADEARNHGEFVSAVARQLTILKRAGLMTGAQQGAIMRAAASTRGHASSNARK